MSDFLNRYFNNTIDYPSNIADDPLPLGVLYEYVSCTFLEGFINYARVESAYVIHRYTEVTDSKRASVAEMQEVLHSKLEKATDDCLILSRTESGTWLFFWFDCDTSDCMIGRFQTEDSTDMVNSNFNVYVTYVQNDLSGGTEPSWPIKTSGWISF